MDSNLSTPEYNLIWFTDLGISFSSSVASRWNRCTLTVLRNCQDAILHKYHLQIRLHRGNNWGLQLVPLYSQFRCHGSTHLASTTTDWPHELTEADCRKWWIYRRAWLTRSWEWRGHHHCCSVHNSCADRLSGALHKVGSTLTFLLSKRHALPRKSAILYTSYSDIGLVD